MAIRWANVPMPEPYLAAVGGAAVMRVVAPLWVPVGAGSRLVGWTALVGGIGLAGWAVASAGDAHVDRDSELVATGAYAHSRNPMYVGWAAAVAGVALLRRDPWLAVGWLFATRAISDEVRREELRLAEQFGAEYGTYCRKVPRYGWPRRR